MPRSMQPTMPISRATNSMLVPRPLMTAERLVARAVWPVTTLMMMPQAAVGMAISAACLAPSMQHSQMPLRPTKSFFPPTK